MQIERHGITWRFDRDAVTGQFVNGDPWVAGPVTIAGITPAPSGGNNGSMVNPSSATRQAYDSDIYGYDSSLGKRPPFALEPGESLVSTVSHPGGETTDVVGALVRTPYLRSAAVLTVVEEAPAEACFRPPYFGSNKPKHALKAVQWGRLPVLAAPATVTTSLFEASTRHVERLWLDHIENWMSRRMHPCENMPAYGREIVQTVGDVGLLLCLDRPAAEKRPLGIGMIQIGIDMYAVAKLHKRVWFASGGHSMGRKFPILFAGQMLGDAGMLALNDYAVQEDQCYFGQDMDPPQTLWTGWQDSGHQYAANVLFSFNPTSRTWGDARWYEHVPPTEWGAPERMGGSNSPAGKMDPYRRLIAPVYLGQALAARLMDLQEHWRNDAFFAYCDRWVYEDDGPVRAAITAAGYGAARPYGGTFSSTFVREMWERHR
jgi:hypothetical protein